MSFLSKLATLLPEKTAYAHCDIPCGIYDPYASQLAAISVIRMTQMLQELKMDDEVKKEHQVMRLTKVKEDHAEIVKHEVRVIWGDYFKAEHVKDYPNLHELVFSIMKLASKSRQDINMEAAQELLTKLHEFAEIFWKTKNRETQKVAAASPSGGEIVVPK